MKYNKIEINIDFTLNEIFVEKIRKSLISIKKEDVIETIKPFEEEYGGLHLIPDSETIKCFEVHLNKDKTVYEKLISTTVKICNLKYPFLRD